MKTKLFILFYLLCFTLINSVIAGNKTIYYVNYNENDDIVKREYYYIQQILKSPNKEFTFSEKKISEIIDNQGKSRFNWVKFDVEDEMKNDPKLSLGVYFDFKYIDKLAGKQKVLKLTITVFKRVVTTSAQGQNIGVIYDGPINFLSTKEETEEFIKNYVLQLCTLVIRGQKSVENANTICGYNIDWNEDDEDCSACFTLFDSLARFSGSLRYILFINSELPELKNENMFVCDIGQVTGLKITHKKGKSEIEFETYPGVGFAGKAVKFDCTDIDENAKILQAIRERLKKYQPILQK